MFTFRTTTLFFFIILLLMNVFMFAGIHIHFGFYLLLIILYITVSVTASFFICSGFHMKALCRRSTDLKVIALTFDDGPHEINTPQILDILKDRAKATFFCIGSKMKNNEHLLKRIDSEGHLIGTHSFSHSNWFDLYSSSRMKHELLKSEEMLTGITGRRPRLFRPPYGVINPMLKKALASFSYHIIGYSNRSLDTVTKDENKILKRLIRKLSQDDIDLLNDTVPFAPSLLNRFLELVAEKGYIVIGLDELLNIKAYEE